jgi:exodeoxyribonuclease V gamma subunit
MAAGDWPHVARDLYGPLADWLEAGIEVAPLDGDAA